MNLLRRIWAAYCAAVGYVPRPDPFSISSPRFRSTALPGGDQ